MRVKQEGVCEGGHIRGSPWRSGILASALTNVREVSFDIEQKPLHHNLNLVLEFRTLSLVGDM